MDWVKEWAMCVCYGLAGGFIAIAMGLGFLVALIVVLDVAVASAIFLFCQWLKYR